MGLCAEEASCRHFSSVVPGKSFHGKEHVQNYVLTLMNIVSVPEAWGWLLGLGWGPLALV